MNLLKIIRATEWWGYKFPPILLMIYFATVQGAIPSIQVYLLFAFVLVSLSVGAIYVSIINDFADIEEDLLAGKSNRLASLSATKRIVLLVVSLLLMAFCCIPLLQYQASLLYYLLAYICFTLYSLNPFRLKHRGLWGVLADASGSQLFPTLYVASLSWAYTQAPLQSFTFGFIALWSLSYGLRGIFYHQFNDRENDRKSGIHTLPQKMTDRQAAVVGWCIFLIEIGSLLGFILTQELYESFIAIGIYILFVLRLLKHQVEMVLITHKKEPYAILMSELYQTIFPITLLILCIIKNLLFIPLTCIYVLFFWGNIKRFLLNSPLYRLFSSK